MKKLIFNLSLLLSFVVNLPQVKGQHLLQALEGYDTPETPDFILPSGIKIENGKYFIASMYDRNYLPFKKPTTSATWERNINPDSNEETKLIDYQGKITTRRIPIFIKINVLSVGSNPKIPAYKKTITIPAWKTEDGISRDITLAWQEQTYDANTKVIRASLRTEEGELNIKKLDLNAGLGNDYQGVELGTFTYNYSAEGNQNIEKGFFEVRALPGIPDKNIETQTTIRGVAGFNHRFIYVPTLGPDGKIWLNNNLGADYSNIDSEHFSPNTQAGGYSLNIETIKRDKKAYGSLFQWQRPADGHEIVKWADRETDIVFSEYSHEAWIDENTSPNNSIFYTAKNYRPTGGYYWRDYVIKDKLDDWKAGGIYNPCPDNFHVPTKQEIAVLKDLVQNQSPDTIIQALRLPYPGRRYHNGGTNQYPEYNPHWDSIFWSSDFQMFTYDFQKLPTGYDTMYAHTLGMSGYPADGIAVRCIQD